MMEIPAEIILQAEKYADRIERRGCSYWNGLYRGYIDGLTVKLKEKEKDKEIERLTELLTEAQKIQLAEIKRKEFIRGLVNKLVTGKQYLKMKIQAEINEEIEAYYWEQKNQLERYGSIYYLTKDAIFGYTLAQKQLEEKDAEIAHLKDSLAIAKVCWGEEMTDRMEKDKEIERLNRILNMHQKSGRI